jgi:hypothetical protein
MREWLMLLLLRMKNSIFKSRQSALNTNAFMIEADPTGTKAATDAPYSHNHKPDVATELTKTKTKVLDQQIAYNSSSESQQQATNADIAKGSEAYGTQWLTERKIRPVLV